MEGQKYISRIIILVGCIILIIQTAYSQTSFSNEIYKAYARGNMSRWLEVMKACEVSTNKTGLQKQLELINYYYGYTGWLVRVNKYELAKQYIDKTDLILDQILADYPLNATAMAYKGAFIAYEIGMSKYKAIFLGEKSIRYIDRGLEIEPDNIQANIEKGNALYYSPSAFGGDKSQSIVYYKIAIKNMEQKQLIKNNWMYLNVMTSLGLAYEATDQIQKAKLCYEKILRIESDFIWVGDELYPNMLKRHNL